MGYNTNNIIVLSFHEGLILRGGGMVDKELLSAHIRNNILSIKSLKQSNPPLAMYVSNNKEIIEKRLNINILNDTTAIRGWDNIKLYLSYYYGNTVNLTRLREETVVIYNNICALGTPEDVIKDMGFKVEYASKTSEDGLIEELKAVADENGMIEKLDKRLDNIIRYKANKENMTVREYIEKLGFYLKHRRVKRKQR